MSRPKSSVGIALISSSVTTLFWLAETLGERGINADVTKTSGYTTTLELVGLVYGVVGLVIGLYLYSKKADEEG